MKKICFITAMPGTARAFLKDHMAALRNNYKVYYVSNERDENKIEVVYDGYHCVDIQRGISLLKDLYALCKLTKYFKSEHFDSVHSVTPKAGLLTAMAAFLAGIPVRIHIFTGQVWANKKGLMRWLLMFMDKLIVLLDNQILVDGEGQRQFLIQKGIVSEKNSIVLGHGSICGVNLKRFVPSETDKIDARKIINIKDNTIVFVFMGRLTRDKGIYELLSAYNMLAEKRNDIFLLIFGLDEENVSSHFNEYKNIKNNINFHYHGRTPEPQKMLQAGDVFVLPTYREGFGMSIIEASALGLPVICSDAYGVKDTIVENETGIRCKVGDVDSLFYAMKTMAESKDMRYKMGKAGRERVVRYYDGERMTNLWVEYYHKLLP